MPLHVPLRARRQPLAVLLLLQTAVCGIHLHFQKSRQPL